MLVPCQTWHGTSLRHNLEKQTITQILLQVMAVFSVARDAYTMRLRHYNDVGWQSVSWLLWHSF